MTTQTTNMNQSNVDEQPMSYADMLRNTMNEHFPLLSEVTQGIVDDPLTLMNAHADEDLRWRLAYIFYLIMQTSAIYNRLRREARVE